jgi:hypothetical protein
MCIRDSYVYQDGVLCFFIHESYVRSVRGYCFVRNYAAIPLQLDIVILQYSSTYLLLLLLLLLQLSFHSLAVVLTLVQTKQIRINIHKRNITKTQ